MITTIGEGDFGIFFRLMAEVECGDHFDFGNEKHVRWLERRIASHFARGATFFGSWLDDGTPVGFAAVLLDERLVGTSRSELLDIGVHAELRNKGYGSELLVHTEEYARQNGVYCMYMSTYARDYRVIAFYGKNGFVPVATLPDVHGPGDEGIVFMRKILR